MTILAYTVVCSVLMCTACGILSPFPRTRTMDDLALELEAGNLHRFALSGAASQCMFYATSVGGHRLRRRTTVRQTATAVHESGHVNNAMLLAIIAWASVGMTIISVALLINDIVAHGFLFAGSILPLVLTIGFPLLSNYAETGLKYSVLPPSQTSFK